MADERLNLSGWCSPAEGAKETDESHRNCRSASCDCPNDPDHHWFNWSNHD